MLPRTADFVLDVVEMLHDLDPDDELSIRAGLDAGPITVGLIGGARLVHDTWGSTVQIAAELARSTRYGQVLVSTACRSHLPERFRVDETDRVDAGVLRGVSVDSEASA